IDPDDLELPCLVSLSRPDGRNQRYSIPDLPVKTIYQLPPHDRAGARLQPRGFLIRRQNDLGVDGEEALRLDGKTPEEILRLVLIDAVEPGDMRNHTHAGDLFDTRLIRHRQRHDERD